MSAGTWILMVFFFNPNYYGDSFSLTTQEFGDKESCLYAASVAAKPMKGMMGDNHRRVVCVPKQQEPPQ